MEDSLADHLKMFILGAFILAGIFSPLVGIIGWQIGSRNIQSADPLTERRAGGSVVCLYFAEQAKVAEADAEIVCTSVVDEVIK